jgi:hypothetical protein
MKDPDMDESERPDSSVTTAVLPDVGLFIELGSCGDEKIARLRGGSGSLTRRIKAAIFRWREELGTDPVANVVPVVLLYRRVE